MGLLEDLHWRAAGGTRWHRFDLDADISLRLLAARYRTTVEDIYRLNQGRRGAPHANTLEEFVEVVEGSDDDDDGRVDAPPPRFLVPTTRDERHVQWARVSWRFYQDHLTGNALEDVCIEFNSWYELRGERFRATPEAVWNSPLNGAFRAWVVARRNDSRDGTQAGAAAAYLDHHIHGIRWPAPPRGEPPPPDVFLWMPRRPEPPRDAQAGNNTTNALHVGNAERLEQWVADIRRYTHALQSLNDQNTRAQRECAEGVVCLASLDHYVALMRDERAVWRDDDPTEGLPDDLAAVRRDLREAAAALSHLLADPLPTLDPRADEDRRATAENLTGLVSDAEFMGLWRSVAEAAARPSESDPRDAVVNSRAAALHVAEAVTEALRALLLSGHGEAAAVDLIDQHLARATPDSDDVEKGASFLASLYPQLFGNTPGPAALCLSVVQLRVMADLRRAAAQGGGASLAREHIRRLSNLFSVPRAEAQPLEDALLGALSRREMGAARARVGDLTARFQAGAGWTFSVGVAQLVTTTLTLAAIVERLGQTGEVDLTARAGDIAALTGSAASTALSFAQLYTCIARGSTAAAQELARFGGLYGSLASCLSIVSTVITLVVEVRAHGLTRPIVVLANAAVGLSSIATIVAMTWSIPGLNVAAICVGVVASIALVASQDPPSKQVFDQVMARLRETGMSLGIGAAIQWDPRVGSALRSAQSTADHASFRPMPRTHAAVARLRQLGFGSALEVLYDGDAAAYGTTDATADEAPAGGR